MQVGRAYLWNPKRLQRSFLILLQNILQKTAFQILQAILITIRTYNNRTFYSLRKRTKCSHLKTWIQLKLESIIPFLIQKRNTKLQIYLYRNKLVNNALYTNRSFLSVPIWKWKIKITNFDSLNIKSCGLVNRQRELIILAAYIMMRKILFTFIITYCWCVLKLVV